MMTGGFVQTEVSNKIATITFAHPASNSMTHDLLQKLENEINELSKSKHITVIILKSEGEKTFCAGASFDELLLIDNGNEGKKFFSGFANVINAMRKSSKIIVGRVQGKAVGGGVGLIAACDYAMGTVHSSIKLSEIAVGIGPFVIEPAVTRKMGKNAFTKMTLHPDKWFDYQENTTLFDAIHENTAALDEAVDSFTQKLSNYNPEALAEIKKILWEGTENWDALLLERAEISGKLVLSDFTKKALNAFKK
jgi:methylglutaconyl-CoA hydratase